MKIFVSIIQLLIFCVIGLCAQNSYADSHSDNFIVKIADVDPADQSLLEFEDKLYVRVVYESDIPLRFQALAMRNDSTLQVGAIKNLALLHPPGKGEALAWVMYLNNTHIDSVKLTVFNEEWKKLFQLTRDVDVTWQKNVPLAERVLAGWVKPLSRAEKRLTDFFYDPAPNKFGALYDAFFYINLAAIPIYILLQLHMLYRYRYRWRELAMIPVFPYLIVGFYLLVGLEIERSLVITFLFRYTFIAFLWLGALWLAKRFWQHKLPPPKLYKPPKA